MKRSSISILSRIGLLCLFGWIGFVPLRLEAAALTDPDFDEARRAYLAEAVQRFNRELLLLEKQLTWELRSIHHCLEFPGAAGAFDAQAIRDLLQEQVLEGLPELPEDAEPGERVHYWIHSQRADLVYRLMLAGQLREGLLAALSDEEEARQFSWELRQAVLQYAHSDYELSARLLGKIRQSYPYRNVDDLLFFEAESCFAENLYHQAALLYRRLLRNHPDSEYRETALRHLIYVDTYFGQFQTALNDFNEHERGEAGRDWETAYMMGIVHFQLDRIEDAIAILSQLPPGSDYYYRSRHLLGTCFILNTEYSKAIALFEGLLEQSLEGEGFSDVGYLKEDVHVKLGHLYFEEGRFEEAAAMFDSIELGSEWYDDALIGQAWSDLSLSDYANAYRRSLELANHMPDSEYLYEAKTLAGYASEKMEDVENSAEQYGIVLDHAERGENLRVLMNEQAQVHGLIRQLSRMEEQVFVDGDRSLYSDYLDLRNQTRQVFRRVQYAELATANQSMGDYIDERKLILQLREQMDRFSGPRENWSAETELNYLNLRDQVQSLMGKIRVAGLIEIRRNPVVLRENKHQMAKATIDSLIFGTQVELGQIVETRSSLDEEPQNSTGLDEQVLAQRFSRLQNRMDRWRVGTEARRQAPFSSDLPHWSNLAFSRLVLGEIRFEELEDLDERIKELENYLDQIHGLLSGEVTPPGQETPFEQAPAGNEPQDPAGDEPQESAPPEETPQGEEGQGGRS